MFEISYSPYRPTIDDFAVLFQSLSGASNTGAAAEESPRLKTNHVRYLLRPTMIDEQIICPTESSRQALPAPVPDPAHETFIAKLCRAEEERQAEEKDSSDIYDDSDEGIQANIPHSPLTIPSPNGDDGENESLRLPTPDEASQPTSPPEGNEEEVQEGSSERSSDDDSMNPESDCRRNKSEEYLDASPLFSSHAVKPSPPMVARMRNHTASSSSLSSLRSSSTSCLSSESSVQRPLQIPNKCRRTEKATFEQKQNRTGEPTEEGR
ncbi:hypothetical protein EX30DRAFT_378590 [Ascodesmis nigricans]|uniref:Uncharacterized protein n=1 Tax=Ascodesmis nigricans TaxID=341454 RepID=A0A4V3SIN3_9PEZI|nr:hypothetical protein EX30DRAFT_378590 [Ascodesmis nigricans]